jgi:hypothetical protein
VHSLDEVKAAIVANFRNAKSRAHQEIRGNSGRLLHGLMVCRQLLAQQGKI